MGASRCSTAGCKREIQPPLSRWTGNKKARRSGLVTSQRWITWLQPVPPPVRRLPPKPPVQPEQLQPPVWPQEPPRLAVLHAP